MAQPRLIKRRFTWAPRALVVISCALALLAVQPPVQAGTGRAGVRAKTVALRDFGEVALPQSAPRQAPALVSQTPSARLEGSFFSSAQRLHILATVEILHRLLVRELQIPQSQFLPVVWFQPICVAVLPAVSTQAHCQRASVDSSPPPVERVFALRHCLLAPPLS